MRNRVGHPLHRRSVLSSPPRQVRHRSLLLRLFARPGLILSLAQVGSQRLGLALPPCRQLPRLRRASVRLGRLRWIALAVHPQALAPAGRGGHRAAEPAVGGHAPLSLREGEGDRWDEDSHRHGAPSQSREGCAVRPKRLGNRPSPSRRCCSSVVEHPLGKGEVVSSILTSSIMKSLGNYAAAVVVFIGHLPRQCISSQPQPLRRVMPVNLLDHFLAVSQELGDHLEWHASLDHPRGGCVPQNVRGNTR